MKRNKMKSIPFIVLFFIHSILLGYTLYKKKDRKRLVVLLFSGIGLCFLFEYVILSLLKAYQYKPNILKNKQLDNFLGAILSQAIFVPFTGVFLTAFHFSWRGKLMAGFYFAAIEKLFIALGIHQNKWWKTRYTIIFLPVFFLINDVWYKHLKLGTPIFHFGSLFLTVMVNGLNLLFTMSVINNFRFGYGGLRNWQDHFKTAPIYSISLSLFTALILNKNNNKRGMGIAFLFAKLIDLIIMKTGMVKNNFKHPILNNSIHMLMIYLAYRVRKMVYSDI